MTTTISDNTSLFQEVRRRRYNENVANFFKFVGVLCLALAVAGVVMLLAAPHRAPETLNVLLFLLLLLVFGPLDIAVKSIVFAPFLLYCWACIAMVRQRTLLSLIQTAVETGTPLHNIVRAYAGSCSSWSIIRSVLAVALVLVFMPLSLLCLLLYFLYRMIRRNTTVNHSYATRLNRFADALESGHPLEDAVRTHRGLFRYDVAGMIRLGGGAAETLRSLETVSQDERDFAPIRTLNVFRICYLGTIFLHMLGIMTFVIIKIIPQFEAIFCDFDTQLPAMTTLVIVLAEWFGYYWYLCMPLIFLLALAAVAYMILQTGIVSVRPVGMRRVFRSVDAAKFLRVFAVGVRHQFAIPAILEMYRQMVPSQYLRKKGGKIQQVLEQGRDWTDALRRAGFINRPEASLLQSAQRTGNTATVLDQLALSKERLQIRKDDLFSKLAFISLMFLFGAVVGTLVIALFLPLLTLITSLSM